MSRRLKIAQVGLGRLGFHYATHIHFHIENADLVAVCSLNLSELERSADRFDGVQTYSSYDKMLGSEDLDAVVIVSSTATHPPYIMQALDHGLHVFSEKPLALSLSDCHDVLQKTKEHDDQIVVVGFNRRFDDSYLYARRQIDEGKIGEPILVRSQTMDMDNVAKFQLQFAAKSGGIFIDYNVHDIDLSRWYLGAEVESVWSRGGAYRFREFADYGDADFVASTLSFDNGTTAFLTAGRIATHGHDTYTEITGTEGTIRIGRPAIGNLVEIYDKHGMRRDAVQNFWQRFDGAFLTMIRQFVTAVSEGRQMALDVTNALKCSEVAAAMTRSYREDRLVRISEMQSSSSIT